MSTIVHPPQKTPWVRKLKPKLPKYLIRRKASALREKILARKYARIYLEKVFGKYHPTACAQYYKSRLLRKCLEKLKLNWFENKQVYRLTVKATNYYEGKAAGRALQNWQIFTQQSKELKKKLETAGRDYDRRILLRSFEKWKIVMFYKRKLRAIKCAARKLYKFMYISLLLLGQMKSLYCQKRCILLDSEAVLFLRKNLTRMCVNKWKSCLSQKKHDKILESKADEHFRNSLKSLHFKNWHKYICYKRTKIEILKLSTELYGDCLLKKSLREWKYRFEETILEKKNVTMVEKCYRVSIKRKMIKCWKCYAKHKLCNRNLKHKADFFYRMRMKQKTLDSLSKNVIRRRQAKMACQKLNLFYKRVVISNVWNKWSLLIDEKHDWELSDKLRTAKMFYKKRIVKKYFAFWIEYNTSQNRNKVLNLRATYFCEGLYLRKYLETWKLVHSAKKRQTILHKKATKFYDDSLIQICTSKWILAYNCLISLNAKYELSVSNYTRKIMNRHFVAWMNFCNSKIQSENLIQEARQYYLEKLRKKCLNNLSMNVIEMKLRREKLRTANHFYDNRLLRRIFSGWKEYYRQIIEYSAKTDELQTNMRNRSQKTVMFHWKLYVLYKKCNNRKISLSATHHRRKLISKTFTKLKDYVNYRKHKSGRTMCLKGQMETIQYQMKKIYLCRWRNAHGIFLREKSKVFQAHEFHINCLKRKYFGLYLTFYQKHKIKMKLKANLINSAKCYILKKYLSVWYFKYQAVLHNHSKERLAGAICEMKIKCKCFKLWKCYVESKAKQKLELEDAKDFHKKLVVKEGLSYIVKTCLHKIESRYERHLKSVTRKSLQDFEIVKIYFNKWHRAVSCKERNRCPETNRISSYNHLSNERLIPFYPESATSHLVIPEFMRDQILFLNSDKLYRYSSQINRDINKVENKNVTNTTEQSCSVKGHSNPHISHPREREIMKRNDLESIDSVSDRRFLNSVQNVASTNLSGDRQLPPGQENLSKMHASNSKIGHFNVILDFDEWRNHRSQETDRINAITTKKADDFSSCYKIEENLHSNDTSRSPQLEKNGETNVLPNRMSDFEVMKESLESPDSLKTSLNSSKTYAVQSPVFLQQHTRSNRSHCPTSRDIFSTCRNLDDQMNNIILLPPSAFCDKKE